MKNILTLTIKKKWFDMINKGVKKEEYREIKEYWTSILKTPPSLFGPSEFKQFDVVTFRNGYHFHSPMSSFEIRSIEIKEGVKEWGAEEGVKYYVIKLGKRLMCQRCKKTHGVCIKNELLPNPYKVAALCPTCATDLNEDVPTS